MRYFCKLNDSCLEKAQAVLAKAVKERLQTRRNLLKRRISQAYLFPGSKCFKASSRVEILQSFSYLSSLLPEHMFPHSFISKWRMHHCPKSVVWLALLSGRFCVTHVYFISFQTICFLLVCLTQWRRSWQQRCTMPLPF